MEISAKAKAETIDKIHKIAPHRNCRWEHGNGLVIEDYGTWIFSEAHLSTFIDGFTAAHRAGQSDAIDLTIRALSLSDEDDDYFPDD